MFILDVDNPPIVKQSADIDADKSDIRTYHKFLVADDWRLRDLVLNIASKCSDYDKLCVIMSSYNFVKNDIIYNESSLALSPMQVAKVKEGSINDKAILFTSLLKNANFDSRLSYYGDKVYPLLCDVSARDIFNEIIKWQKSNPLISKNITLNKGKVYAIWLDKDSVSNSTAVVISHQSTKPTDILLFHDEAELNQYVKAKDGSYFADCALFDNLTSDMKCATPTKSLLAFLSRYDNNSVDINIRLAGVILSDIKSVSINEKVCVPVDFSDDKQLSYPGIISFNAERLTPIGR